MKLILTNAVDNLGIAGDVVEVKDGYARNYLVPQGLGIKWSRGAETQIEGIKRNRDARQVRDRSHADELRTQIEGLKVQIAVRSSEEGKLFGAVTAADIAKAVKAAGGPTIDKRGVKIERPIKSVGSHNVGVKLHEAVTAHFAVEVVAA
ncbi:LSU ribosomal protein L9P [Raineyella antarctica]|uniref:Large ribosomal subunit protein bL9 n=1 Tax=Raineyella antarctica TaxID=1577474 RepID=A0A1G6HER7_9ACTN|nr:50S ribosomal protein L9 [Raineyella antarctica]SDB92425.1 LSU ribosomal protein L9P [Raineyella antarctica]